MIKRNVFKIKTVKELKKPVRKQFKEQLLNKINGVKSNIEWDLGRFNNYTTIVYRNSNEHIAIRFLCLKNKHLKLTETYYPNTSRTYIIIEERK